MIVHNLFGNVSGKKITILGFAFKANTNDTRKSPAIKICKDLIEEGAYLSIYDPKVDKKTIELDLKLKSQEKQLNLNENGYWEYFSSIEKSVKNSDAIVVLTEWKEFENINWHKLIKLMRRPAWFFDTRSYIDCKKVQKAGFNVWEIGNLTKTK